MDEYGELKVLGKFYGKPVFGNLYNTRDLNQLNSEEDWKFLQFKGEIEVEVPSSHECKVKLPNGINFYLVKRRRTWLGYDWILLYVGRRDEL